MTIIIVVTGQDQDVSEKGKARKRTLKLGPISVQKVGEEDGNGFPIGIASRIQTIKRPPSDIQGLVTWGGGGLRTFEVFICSQTLISLLSPIDECIGLT